MELRALVYIDDPIGRGLAVPHCVVQETLDSVQDHLRQGGDDKEDNVEMTATSKMESPQQSLSLVRRSPSLAIWAWEKSDCSDCSR